MNTAATLDLRSTPTPSRSGLGLNTARLPAPGAFERTLNAQLLHPKSAAAAAALPPEAPALKPLTQTDFIPGAQPLADEHQTIRRHAERLVAQTFFGTLLKQMHESPFKSELFSGGRGGQAFSPLMDQQLAERMARGAGGKLSEQIARQVERLKTKARVADRREGSSESLNDRGLDSSDRPAPVSSARRGVEAAGEHPLNRKMKDVATDPRT